MTDVDHYERGILLYERDRYDLAEKELRLHLAENPDHDGAHRVLALTLFCMKKYEDGLEEARTAVGCDPEEPHNHYIYGHLLRLRDKFKEAEEEIQLALSENPFYENYHLEAAHISFDTKKYQEAVDRCEDALNCDPNCAGAYRLRALSLWCLDKMFEAEAAADDALRAEPNNARSHATMGWILLEKKKTVEAIGYLREALRIDPTDTWARSGLLEAMRSRNPLYGFFLGAYWKYSSWTPPFIFWHPAAFAAILAIWGVFSLVKLFMVWMGPHILNMMMWMDPIAKQALHDNEVRDGKLLLCWTVVAYVIVLGLLVAQQGWAPYFAPAYVFLYGMPIIFTRIFELEDDRLKRKAKIYTGIAAALGVTSLVFGFTNDPLQNNGQPPPMGLYDIPAITMTIFCAMCFASRSFPALAKVEE